MKSCILLTAGTWSTPMVSGTPPPPLAYFSFDLYDQNHAVLYGGRTEGGGESEDVYILDVLHWVGDSDTCTTHNLFLLLASVNRWLAGTVYCKYPCKYPWVFTGRPVEECVHRLLVYSMLILNQVILFFGMTPVYCSGGVQCIGMYML